MFEKIKKMLKEKDEKKKMENLIAFLIILVVTLIIMNKILGSDSKSKEEMSSTPLGAELVNNQKSQAFLMDEVQEDTLEQKLEKILSEMEGVREN